MWESSTASCALMIGLVPAQTLPRRPKVHTRRGKERHAWSMATVSECAKPKDSAVFVPSYHEMGCGQCFSRLPMIPYGPTP
jgi:hypothetical protein